MKLLSEDIRYFSFHLGELHGTKKQAQKFFREWADRAEELEATIGRLREAAQFLFEREEDGFTVKHVKVRNKDMCMPEGMMLNLMEELAALVPDRGLEEE